MQRKLMVVAAASLMLATPVWAARLPVHEAAESPEYGRKFGGMLGRGVINGTTGFVDILVNLVNETRQGPPLVGTLVGLGKGVGCGSLRTLSGAVDLTTFWVPGFNGVPVSDSYENCMAMESEDASGSEAEHQGGALSEGASAMTEPPPAGMNAPAQAPAASPKKKEERPRYTK